MQTLRNTPVKNGDVVDTKSAVSGNSYGTPQIVVDQRASDSQRFVGGFQTRDATPQEVAQARRDGNFITDIG